MYFANSANLLLPLHTYYFCSCGRDLFRNRNKKILDEWRFLQIEIGFMTSKIAKSILPQMIILILCCFGRRIIGHSKDFLLRT